jgi:hypothetical protein
VEDGGRWRKLQAARFGLKRGTDSPLTVTSDLSLGLGRTFEVVGSASETVGSQGSEWLALGTSVESRKAAFIARFWSILTAASYHPFGSRSSGWLAAIITTASPIFGSSPRLNFTTMVFGLVYPDSEIKSQKSSR